jgi:arylsulfatase A-like enzyme
MGIQHRTDPAKSNRVYPPLPLVSGDEVIQQQPDQTALTERYVEKAIDFIRKSKEDPFFLYFAHMHVHLPLYAAEQFYKNSINGDFGACMASVDWSVHAITDELKRLGKYEDTILIFTSDNGSRADHGASNHPLKGKKATVWEGGIRVPCVVHWKGHIKEGVRINSIASNIDLLPTLAAITGGKLSDNQIDGVDVSALFYGEDRAVRTQMIYYRNTILSAVRKDQMKLHLNRDGEAVCELYDLENDISEENDIASQNPEIVEELSKLAEEYRYKLGDSFYHISGTENRDCNITENAIALTAYDENHPYIIAMYDKPDCG